MWQASTTIYGPPGTQGSKRVIHRGNKPLLIEDSHKSRPWRHELVELMQPHAPSIANFPVAVMVTIYMRRPRAHYGTGKNMAVLKPKFAGTYPTRKPDADKVLRAVMDAMTYAGWVHDDAHVAFALCAKLWAPDGLERVQVTATHAHRLPVLMNEMLMGWVLE